MSKKNNENKLYFSVKSDSQVDTKWSFTGLESLQAAVGGYIEYLKINDICYLLVNEDARRLNLPLNPFATALARIPIYGDVVVVEEVRDFTIVTMK